MKDRLVKIRAAIVGILLSMCLLFQPAVVGQDAEDDFDCGTEKELPSACRIVGNRDQDAQGPLAITSLAFYLPTPEIRNLYFEQITAQDWSLGPESKMSEVKVGYAFGDNQRTFEGIYAPGQEAAGVVYWTDTLVGLWIVRGRNFEALNYLQQLHASLQPVVNSNASESVLSQLPTLADVPEDFFVFAEQISPLIEMATPMPTATRTSDELEATINALETQVATEEVRPSPTSTPKPTSTSPPRPTPTDATVISGPLELIDISSRSAGLGDGTYYVYVEVRNVTYETLGYVSVDITCRDSSGTVVTTGIANSLNLAPGATVVLTGILLGASTCTDIEVVTSPLTGAF